MKVEHMKVFKPVLISLETEEEIKLFVGLIESRLQCSSPAQAQLGKKLMEFLGKRL
jgi:hypothetical protein